MPRIRLTLAYDGTDFSGWQLQPDDRTVQGVIEHRLAEIIGSPTRVHGSGRTDSGVHALGQVAHFDCPEGRASIPWQRALNATLPKDVRVIRAKTVTDDFHARYSAVGKTYEYVLWHNQEYCLPTRRRFVWDCGHVDREAMLAGARELTGRHDFAAFQNVGTPVKSTVRTISDISCSKGMTPHETVWRFTADGFLKQMVRNIMGCLVACGKGKLLPEDIRAIAESLDRSTAPATAPPQGLSLVSVQYDESARQSA